MTDSTIESELTQRKGAQIIPEDSASDEEPKEVVKAQEEEEEEEKEEKEEKEKEVRSTWQSVKYYFNRFRYYHFVVADTVDKYVSAACLWFINWYFKLFMGVNAPQSVLDE